MQNNNRKTTQGSFQRSLLFPYSNISRHTQLLPLAKHTHKQMSICTCRYFHKITYRVSDKLKGVWSLYNENNCIVLQYCYDEICIVVQYCYDEICIVLQHFVVNLYFNAVWHIKIIFNCSIVY